jgi:hypothetical protein
VTLCAVSYEIVILSPKTTVFSAKTVFYISFLKKNVSFFVKLRLFFIDQVHRGVVRFNMILIFLV